MTIKKHVAGLASAVLLTCGCVTVSGQTLDNKNVATWSNWIHDERVLPELYLRSRCVNDPNNEKKSRWEIQFSDIGSALVRVGGKDWHFDIPPQGKAGNVTIDAKSCSKPVELKMDGRIPSKGYAYKLTYKGGVLTVKPHEHVDWMGYALAAMEGAAAGMDGQPIPQR